MKKINNVIIYVVTFISFLIAIKDFNNGRYDRLLGDLTIFFVFMIPKVLKKVFKFNFGSNLEFIYVIFIVLAQFLGSVINLFNTIWWYDLFTHFISGVLTSILGLLLLNKFSINNKKFNLLFIIIFTVFIAALWEFLEFFADSFLKMNVQHSIETGVNDTMEDMLIATFGSVLVFIKYKFEKSKNNVLSKFVTMKN